MFVFWYDRNHKAIRQHFLTKIRNEEEFLDRALAAPPENEETLVRNLRRMNLLFKAKRYLVAHDELVHMFDDSLTRALLTPLLESMLNAWLQDDMRGIHHFQWKAGVLVKVQLLQHKFDQQSFTIKFHAATNAILALAVTALSCAVVYAGLMLMVFAMSGGIPLGFAALGIALTMLGVFAMACSFESTWHNSRVLWRGQIKDIQNFSDALVGNAPYEPAYAAEGDDERLLDYVHP